MELFRGNSNQYRTCGFGVMNLTPENNQPWDFLVEMKPSEQNINPPPTTDMSEVVNNPNYETGANKRKRLGQGSIALIVGASLAAVISCVAVIIAFQVRQRKLTRIKRMESGDGSNHSLPMSLARECYSDSPEVSSFNSPPQIASRHLPPNTTKFVRVNRRKSYSKETKGPVDVKLFTFTELKAATSTFSEANILGPGSLGVVYKGELSDGQIVAVKHISTIELSFHEEQTFLDVISKAYHLRHPNIVRLLGYCQERGHYLLVYEYVTNLSLETALHCQSYKPLSWGLRVQIALGIARALNYLHSTCMPLVAHSSLKAANVLLDEDLVPHVSDCGLAVLKPLTRNSVKLMASEMALYDSRYVPPDQIQRGSDNTRGDIYAFGVILLELLTGRKPFGRSEEYSLVKWASSQLHDRKSLEQMVDPPIRGTISPYSLSRFADIVSLCIQEKSFRPPVSDIIDSLTRILEDYHGLKGNAPEVDPCAKSFMTTGSHFVGSPTPSFVSAAAP